MGVPGGAQDIPVCTEAESQAIFDDIVCSRFYIFGTKIGILGNHWLEKRHYFADFIADSAVFGSPDFKIGIFESKIGNIIYTTLGGFGIRNSKNKERCEKQSFTKHAGVCRTYSELQLAYAQQIEANPNIVEFRCNVPLPDFEMTDGSYTTDFVCTTTTGDMMVRECIKRTHIYRPKKIKMLDASREY